MSEKAILNTSISSNTLEDFRERCKEFGVPMNTILESFMRQFADGEFVLKLGKSASCLDLEE